MKWYNDIIWYYLVCIITIMVLDIYYTARQWQDQTMVYTNLVIGNL